MVTARQKNMFFNCEHALTALAGFYCYPSALCSSNCEHWRDTCSAMRHVSFHASSGHHYISEAKVEKLFITSKHYVQKFEFGNTIPPKS